MRALILFVFVIVCTTSFSQNLGDTTAQTAGVDSLLVVRKDTVTIIGVGDIMMGTNYPEDKLPSGDGAFLMKDVEVILSNADITFGNLEGTLLNEGGTPKKCKDPKVCYAFRTPVRYVKNLVNAGFDIMSLANNHAGDFGDAGRNSSMKTLEAAGILHAGQLNQKTVIIVKDSVRYGLVAFSPNTNCVPFNDHVGGAALVKQLDSLVDIVIVSFHGGAEGAQHQSVPRTYEMFHGENRGDVYKFSRVMIDAGADIVFGHGPHVTRAVDIYKNRFIAYSMGNFCTYRGINVAGVSGLAPIMKVYTDKEGKLYKAQIIPTYQTYGTGVKLDPSKQIIKKIQELTKKDIPESPARIDDDGIITYLAE